MGEYRFVRKKTTKEDMAKILANLRDYSRDELLVVAGTEEQALEQAIDGSRDVWSGYINDELGIVYGVKIVNILSNHAYIWMLTTEQAEKHWVTFVRVSTMCTWELLNQYEKITAISPLRSKVSHKWLEYIGFKQTGVARIYGIKFKTYEITRDMLADEKIQWFRGDDGWQPLLAS